MDNHAVTHLVDRTETLLKSPIREWRVLREFPDYEISNDGRLRRLTTSGQTFKAGYPIRISLATRYPSYGLSRPDKTRACRPAHLLVAAEFLPPAPPDKPFVLHDNDIRLDCRHTNLKWGDRADNTTDARKNNRLPKGPTHHNTAKPWNLSRGEERKSKLSDQRARSIFLDSRLQYEIAADHGVTQSLVSRIKNKKTWRHVNDPEYRAFLEKGRSQCPAK